MPPHLPRRQGMFAVVPALVAVVVLAAAACGGSGDDGGEPASDEEYIRGACTALASFQEELEAIDIEAGSVSDILDAMEDLADALDNVADQLDDINPPGDIAEFHNAVIRFYRDAVQALRDGDLAALASFEPGDVFDPPADVEERLRAAAESVEECQGLGLFR